MSPTHISIESELEPLWSDEAFRSLQSVELNGAEGLERDCEVNAPEPAHMREEDQTWKVSNRVLF